MPARTIRNLALALTLAASVAPLRADPVPVRQTQGLTHGFLTMRSEDGKIIAKGELIQVAHGERVSARLLHRFTDGSIDEDTVTYLQHGTFKLLRDHHVQKGPYFPKPSDFLVDVASGNVTSRSVDKDGKEKVEVQHMDLPADVYNGLIGTILLNVARDTPRFKIGLVAPTGKGRLVKIAITPDGEGTFSEAGQRHKATLFRLKIELGGIVGVVAPIVGKQPADTLVWILEGEAPGFVGQIGPLYEGSPIVDIQVSGTSFPRAGSKKP